VQADTIIARLDDPRPIQRDKLAALRSHIATIRAYDDGDYARVIRAIKKRLNSPKLTAEVAALLGELGDGRVSIPAPAPPRPAPPPVPPVVVPDAPDALLAPLEAEILRDPDAQDAYLAYGDYLASKGEPLGELIAIGRELAKNPGHKHMLAAHDALAPKLLGPLVNCGDMMTNVDWHMGFIKSCRLAYTMDRFNGRDQPSLEDAVGWLVDDPAPGRFLQNLTVGLVRHDDNHYQRIGALLAKRRRALRSLYFGDFDRDECELNWTSLGDISALWAAVPDLRDLKLRAGDMTLGPLHLPKLDSLEIVTGGLDAKSLGHIAAADWPSLARMVVQTGAEGVGSPEALAPLWAGERVPKLRHLGITNCTFTDSVVELVAESKLLAQLEVLDLSMGTLGEPGFATLARHRDRFAHLQRLVLGGEDTEPREVLAGTPVQVVWEDRYGPVYE
jgi:uncharacterized protein (TIGR02996 family)